MVDANIDRSKTFDVSDASRRTFDNRYFFRGQLVQLINKFVNAPVKVGDAMRETVDVGIGAQAS